MMERPKICARSTLQLLVFEDALCVMMFGDQVGAAFACCCRRCAQLEVVTHAA